MSPRAGLNPQGLTHKTDTECGSCEIRECARNPCGIRRRRTFQKSPELSDLADRCSVRSPVINGVEGSCSSMQFLDASHHSLHSFIAVYMKTHRSATSAIWQLPVRKDYINASSNTHSTTSRAPSPLLYALPGYIRTPAYTGCSGLNDVISTLEVWEGRQADR